MHDLIYDVISLNQKPVKGEQMSSKTFFHINFYLKDGCRSGFQPMQEGSADFSGTL